MVLYNNIFKKSRGFGNVSKKTSKNIIMIYTNEVLSLKKAIINQKTKVKMH